MWARLPVAAYASQHAINCAVQPITQPSLLSHSLRLRVHAGDGVLKVTDTGSAVQYAVGGPPVYQVRGTAIYSGPDMLSGQLTFATDVWSAGGVLHYLATERWPFWRLEDGADRVKLFRRLAFAGPLPVPERSPYSWAFWQLLRVRSRPLRGACCLDRARPVLGDRAQLSAVRATIDHARPAMLFTSMSNSLRRLLRSVLQ